MTLSLLKIKNKVSVAPLPRVSAETSNEIAPGEGRLLRWLIGGALFALPLILLVFYYRAMFAGLTNDSALDFAQLGRNLSEGHGFTTYFLRPLALTHGTNALRQPDLTHGPLYPVLLALGFGALGAKDSVAAGISGLFYVLTVPVLYWLGTRVFHRTVGLLAALVFAANPLMLEYAVSGLPITFFTFLTTVLLLVMHSVAVTVANRSAEAPPAARASAQPNLSKAPFVLAGLITGALYLTDPIFIWFVPVILTAVVVLSGARRIQALGLFLLPLGALTLPWMIRNLILTGNPIFGLRGMEVWMNTKDFYPGEVAYRYTPGDLVPGVGLFQAVVRKLLLGAGQVVESFPQVSASWMLAFLLPSLLFRFKETATNSLRRVMMYCFAGVLIGMLPLGIEMPVFACLIPAMLVFAIAYLLHLVEQAQLPRPSVVLLTALLGAAMLLPVLRQMVLTDKPAPRPEVASARALRQALAPGDVVLSDQPWVVAWYADRPAVWIPAVDKQIKEVRTQFPGARWLFLTDQTRGLSPQWQYIYAMLQQWNQVYIQAQTAGKPTPGQVRISGAGDPLIESLNGFTVLPPARGTSPTVVIAAVPK